MNEILLPTYEAFVSFLFNERFLAPSGELLRESTVGTPWYDDLDVDLDDTTCARYYILLFESSAGLIAEYSHEALESAFAAMIDCNFPLSVSELVWNDHVSIEVREDLIGSMVPLYERFFALKPFWYSTNMWWDALAYAYCCGNAFRGRSENETRLQDAMFAALEKILVIPTDECRHAALHGLGHLRHPDTEKLIGQFLVDHPDLPAGTREYALAAVRGDIQ